MLIDALINEFTTYFDQDPGHYTILWFDPSGELEALLPHLRPRMPRLIVREGQLHIRYLLAQRAPGARVVVYLPLAKEKAIYLRPYFSTAKCHQESIAHVLHQSGIVLPDDRQLRALLPELATASIGKGKTFWQGIVNLETALGRLMPDFDEKLLRWLAAPQTTRAELENQGAVQAFFTLAKLQFGVPAPEPGQEDAWADRFTALLCLVEARAAAPTAPDFPFEDSLPPKMYWEPCRAFLRRWQHHELFKAAFKQRVQALDAAYHLGGWAANLPPGAVGSSFLNVEQALWEQMQVRLDALQDRAEALALVQAYQDVFRQRAASFWAREGDVPGWQALLGMGETLLLSQEALREALECNTPAAMVAQYAAAWQRVDAAYRRFCTQLDRTGAQLDAALKWTERTYREYLNGINGHFTALVAQAQQWPPAGCTLAGAALWAAPPAAVKGLHALVMVDALRYELAQDMIARLNLGQNALTAHLSPVPSITELGMAALLPGWERFRVTYEDGWGIQAPGSSDNLVRKDKRLAYLTARLGKTAVFDLDQWLATPLNSLNKDVGWIVITSQAIDAAGEGIGAVALHTFDALLDRLEQGVRRLLAVGCAEISIASDHGFLLRETIREADKVNAKEPGLLKKHARYAVAHGAAYAGAGADWVALPHLPVHGSADLVAWFPRGVGCFLTPGPYNYMHGGIALQEVVVPVIQIRQTALERPVGVTLELADGGLTAFAEIRNAIFKVRLIPTGADLLSRPRQVEIDIVKQGQRVSRVWEVQVERDVIEKSLMLETAYGLQYEDTVEIRVRDAITSELLDSKTAIVKVDLDL